MVVAVMAERSVLGVLAACIGDGAVVTDPIIAFGAAVGSMGLVAVGT